MTATEMRIVFLVFFMICDFDCDFNVDVNVDVDLPFILKFSLTFSLSLIFQCKVHPKYPYSQVFPARLYEMVRLVYEMVFIPPGQGEQLSEECLQHLLEDVIGRYLIE